MRTLASLGILTEDATHQFALTPLGEALQTGAPGSAHPTILTFAGDWWWRGCEQLLYSVETGKSAFERSLGMPIFDWLAQNPEEASLFSQTMIGVNWGEPKEVAAAYDFSGLTTIIDVGGANGHLLTTILSNHPATRGGERPNESNLYDRGVALSTLGLRRDDTPITEDGRTLWIRNSVTLL